MSHSSGIPVSDSLRQEFGQANNNKDKRLIKVQIVNEELVAVKSENTQGSWEDDFKLIPSLLDKESPSFILYLLEDGTWAFFSYVPDKAKVKEKMTYASSRSTLKMQLGGNVFSDEVFGTNTNDFSLDGYKHHVTSKKSDAPLTDSEQMKKNEMENGSSAIYTGGSTTYVHGVAFPVDASVTDAIKSTISGSINYVQIAIDCDNEKVILDHSGTISIEELPGKIPTDQPRFHLFAWKHNNEGSELTSNVYIYSSPDGSGGTKSAPVRMRMLYSSSKANVESIVKSVGGTIDGKLEVNNKDDLSEEIIQNLIHPPKEEKKTAFKKPTGPGKGTRKLVGK